jgi:hypothetical protein
MTQSVAALYHGREYQTRLFWMKLLECSPRSSGSDSNGSGRSRADPEPGILADGALLYANHLYPAVEEQ